MSALTAKQYRKLAADCERQGELSLAASYWLKAVFAGTDPQNKTYCQKRAAFCERWNGRLEPQKAN